MRNGGRRMKRLKPPVGHILGTLALSFALAGCGSASVASIWTNPAVTSRAWGSLGSSGFSGNAAGEVNVAIAPNGTPYIAYQDWGGTQGMTVRRFDGTNWVLVGPANFSTFFQAAGGPSLAFDQSGTPYVAYIDPGLTNEAIVKRFDGTNWVTTDVTRPSGNVSTADARYTCLAKDPYGNLYLAYSDSTASLNWAVTLQKYNGTSWSVVPNAPVGFTPGAADWVSLAIEQDGTPIVAFSDSGSGGLTVMAYAGGVVTALGSPGFAHLAWGNTSLKVDPAGTPTVAFVDPTYSSKARVMRFAGGTWVNVGQPGFTAGPANAVSLSFGGVGLPYVAFQDGATGPNDLTLMSFTGGGWEPVGAAGFSATAVTYLSLAMDSNGAAYVVDAAQTGQLEVWAYK
jgi:hypothetical protein